MAGFEYEIKLLLKEEKLSLPPYPLGLDNLYKKYPFLSSLLKMPFLKEVYQKDTYWEHPLLKLQEKDQVLRKREIQKGKKKNIFLTYKSPKEGSSIKKRKEIEEKISPFIWEILKELGFYPSLVVEKIRFYFSYHEYLFQLDLVKDLGIFLEIEFPYALNEKELSSFLQKEGLSSYPIIEKSYAELLREKACFSGEKTL